MTKEEIELQKLRTETSKMLADMEHNIEQRHHWIETREIRSNHWRETREAQFNHWRRQQYYWIGTVIFAIVAILASPFLTVIAKHYWPS